LASAGNADHYTAREPFADPDTDGNADTRALTAPLADARPLYA
jgi:hypothetical protein